MIYKKVCRHGDSLAVVIPIEMCREIEIKRGDYVAIALTENDLLIIKKADPRFVEHLVNQPIQNET